MDIKIKEIKSSSDVEGFVNEQWEIVNKRYNFLPPRETFFFGAYLDNELVGYAKTELRGGIAETRDLLVKDELTGKNIGGSLLNHVERWAKDNNCRKSVIKTSSIWKRSIRFYEKNGYKKDVCLKNYYYGCDWYYMSKEL